LIPELALFGYGFRVET